MSQLITSLPLAERLRNRDNFLDILTYTVPDIPGTFLTFLEKSDFFTAPASTQYHEAYEGGLAKHSLKVYENLAQLNYLHFLGFPDDAIAKVALLHDICKISFYTKKLKNVKLEDGRWVRTEAWSIKDGLPLGHGEKSLAVLLQQQVVLTEEEQLAIRWHMGRWDDAANGYGGLQSLNAAMNKTKLVTALQIADVMSVRLNGES